MICRILTGMFLVFSAAFYAQEGLRPLNANMNYIYKNLHPQDSRAGTDISAQRPAAATSHTLPFVEDFFYAPTRFYPDPDKWEDSTVYVNCGMPIAPPSIGVATFDGLNKNGYPYNPTLSNLTIPYPADVLTSKPINLFTAGQVTLNPATADVALSFYYQARGNGDRPEPSDSLLVDFYCPTADSATAWKRVWFAQGNSNSSTVDTVFKRAFIRIKDTAYFHDGFRFRFRNYASPTGNFDHWHVDYIFLDQNRGDSLVDTVRNDITFANMPSSFLKDYSEMPVQQYRDFEMAPQLTNRIRNNGGAQVNMAYKYQVLNMFNNQVISEYDGGFANLNPFIPNNESPAGNGYSPVVAHAKPNIQDTFLLTLPTSVEFPVKHFVYLNTGFIDDIKENDTVMQYQRFRNFYAHDDGSAERGYYINAPQARMAVKVRLNATDSLLGMRIYFDPAGRVSSISNTVVSVYTFTMNVWSQGSDGAPGTLIARDSSSRYPIYLQGGFKDVPEFRFTNPVVLGPGTYFIGIQQSASTITIGFDKNTYRSGSMYFDSGEGWKPSQERGSVMINPVFGTFKPTVGIQEVHATEKKKFFVYPNPASEQFTIVTSEGNDYSYQLYSAMGQLVQEEELQRHEHTVSTGSLSPGLYVLILRNKEQVLQQQKIIIQH